MRSTGIVRKIDTLGRIVIPQELRTSWDMPEKTPMEIFTDSNTIVLKKYEPGCIFCGTVTDRLFKGNYVCDNCRHEIKQGIRVYSNS